MSMLQAVANFKEFYRENALPKDVGRSFIYSWPPAFILNGGETNQAFITAGSCALMTFTASVLSPMVAGIFGYSHREPLEGMNLFIVQASVITVAALVLGIAVGIFINPYLVGLSIVLCAGSSVYAANAYAGQSIVLMHPMGLLGSMLHKGINGQ